MRTVRCPEHDGRSCVNCGGTGRVEADEQGRPWWESAFAPPPNNGAADSTAKSGTNGSTGGES